MKTLEIEIIKKSSEFKAASALAEAHNSMCFNHEKFAKGVCLDLWVKTGAEKAQKS